MAEAEGALEVVVDLVDQYRVGHRPSGRSAPGCRVGPQEYRALGVGQQIGAVPVQRRGVREQAEQHGLRVECGPHRSGVPLDRCRAGHGVLHPVVWGVAGLLHLEQDRVGETVRQHPACRVVPHPSGPQLLHDLGHLGYRHPPLVSAARQYECLCGCLHIRPHGRTQDLRQAGVSLQDGGADAVPGAHRHRCEQLVDRAMSDLDLAESRKHGADVIEERAVGTDDQDAAASKALPKGIEQPCRPVQADRGLAGAGRTLDADRYADVAAHDRVLLWLDRGHYVAHGPDSGTFNLTDENLAPEGGLDRRCNALAAIEVFILIGRQLTPVDPEPSTQAHAHVLGR